MKKGIFIFLLFIIMHLMLTHAITVITGDTITGKASVQPTNVSITVFASPPTLTLLSPENTIYITNISILLNFTVSNENKIWYHIDELQNKTITTSLYFNVSQGNHTLWLYVNNTDGNITSAKISFLANSTRFTIIDTENEDTTDGTGIRNRKGSTTDFLTYSFEELQNLSNIIFDEPNLGKIQFNQVINLTNDADPNDNSINIDGNFDISSNRIEIDSTNLPNFDKQATLWFYNLTFTNPRILKDGEVCSPTICTQESYLGGTLKTLKFNVTGFTVYSAEETPDDSGNGNGGNSGVGGGGGGGGGGTAISQSIKIDKEKIQVSLKQGETKIQKITIENIREQKAKITISIPKLKSFLKISEKSFELEAGKSKTINLEISAKENTLQDLYVGELSISDGVTEKKVLIAIEVESVKPLFDAKIKILKEQVRPGKEISANISLYNVEKTGKVDVTVNYMIKDEEGSIVTGEQDTLAIETEKSFIKTLKIPEDTKKGIYIFYVKITYSDQMASTSAWFSVNEKSFFKIESINLILIVLVSAILLIIIYKLKLRKHIKRKIKKTKK